MAESRTSQGTTGPVGDEATAANGVQLAIGMGSSNPLLHTSFARIWRLNLGAIALVALTVVAGACATAIDSFAIADAQTAARVKTALVNDPVVGTLTIEVRVRDGVANLSGLVANESEAERARTLAQAVSGVTGVRSSLRIGEVPTEPVPGKRPVDVQTEFDELGLGPAPEPRWLAVGASVGWSHPSAASLGDRMSLAPLIRLGAGRGLGVAIGLDWFQASLQLTGDAGRNLTRVRVRPVMVGVGYTFAASGFAVSPSLVGGVALNSFRVAPTATVVAPLALDVSNSLVWRPAVSVWFDVSRRVAMNIMVGRVITRLGLTVLDGDRLDRRHVRGDSTTLHAGLVYKLF
jgi:hypothetical protein